MATHSSVFKSVCGNLMLGVCTITLTVWLEPSMHHLLAMHASSCVLKVSSLFLLSFSDLSLSSSLASHLARDDSNTVWNNTAKEGSLSLCLLADLMVISEACSDPGSRYLAGSIVWLRSLSIWPDSWSQFFCPFGVC